VPEEIRVGHIQRFAMGTLTNPNGAPSGPGVGFPCAEYPWALLRIVASVNVSYSLRVYTFENETGNDWIEDPSERQTPAVGEDYTRYFFVHGADKIYIEFTAITGGNVMPFVSLS